VDAEREFADLVDLARRDDGIVGLVLTGSRASGFAVTEASDWDVRLIVRDGVLDEYRGRFGTPHGSPVEVFVLTFDKLAAVGEIGSRMAWDRPSYVHAQVVVDSPDGRVSALIDALRTLPPDVVHALAPERLDDYVNAYHRSAKSHRLGLEPEARLDAAESIPPLLDTLFALHGRVRPFNKHLRFELERRPLDGEPWTAATLVPRLESILATGDLGEQQRLFRDVEALARDHGLGEVIDGWEPDVARLRGEGG
jgi:predicted nucleotidyltransferase